MKCPKCSGTTIFKSKSIREEWIDRQPINGKRRKRVYPRYSCYDCGNKFDDQEYGIIEVEFKSMNTILVRAE